MPDTSHSDAGRCLDNPCDKPRNDRVSEPYGTAADDRLRDAYWDKFNAEHPGLMARSLDALFGAMSKPRQLAEDAHEHADV